MDHPNSQRALAYFDELFPLEPPPMATQLKHSRDRRDIISEILAFNEFGASTFSETRGEIPYFVNEFWTSGQRQGHSIHEVSYRACFKAQLPEFFISRLTEVGDSVYDPFMGRGTTPVQAALQGRRPLGSDINPLSKLLVRPRLEPPSLIKVAELLETIPWDRSIDVREDLLAFYHPDTLRRLTNLRHYFLQHIPIDASAPDPVLDWVRMVAINRLTGHSPGFFSVYTLPPNQAVSVEAQRKINAKRHQTPEPRDIVKIIMKKSKSLLSDGVMPHHPPGKVMTGASNASRDIDVGEVDLVVTSPPFLDIVQYAQDNWLRCWFAGIDVNQVEIAMHRTEELWTTMVRETLIEQARIVRSGGHVAFEVGEVRNGKILLERLVWRAAEGLPFDRMGVMINQQNFTKTANCWGVRNNNSGTNTNRIVLLRKQ